MNWWDINELFHQLGIITREDFRPTSLSKAVTERDSAPPWRTSSFLTKAIMTCFKYIVYWGVGVIPLSRVAAYTENIEESPTCSNSTFCCLNSVTLAEKSAFEKVQPMRVKCPQMRLYSQRTAGWKMFGILTKKQSVLREIKSCSCRLLAEQWGSSAGCSVRRECLSKRRVWIKCWSAGVDVPRRPCREAEPLDQLFIPQGSTSHPHRLMQMSPLPGCLIKATQLEMSWHSVWLSKGVRMNKKKKRKRNKRKVSASVQQYYRVSFCFSLIVPAPWWTQTINHCQYWFQISPLFQQTQRQHTHKPSPSQ